MLHKMSEPLPIQGSHTFDDARAKRVIELAREREIRVEEKRKHGLKMYRADKAAWLDFRTHPVNHPLHAILGSEWAWEYNRVTNQFTVSQGRLRVEVFDLEDCIKWGAGIVVPMAVAINAARVDKVYGHMIVQMSCKMKGRTPNVVHTFSASIVPYSCVKLNLPG